MFERGGLIFLVCLLSWSVSQDCVLTIPPNPLTAAGLATPFSLSGCDQLNASQATFVQALIVDGTQGNTYVYNPLVINAGTQPLVTPIKPNIPANITIGIWIGTNGASLTLQDDAGSLTQGNCLFGAGGSNFGQFGFCNVGALYSIVNSFPLAIPGLALAKDGRTCPSPRDFFVSDIDYENVYSNYLVQASQVLQAYPTAVSIASKGKYRVLVDRIYPALGCSVWTLPDLADITFAKFSTALPLLQIQAAKYQKPPVALFSLGHSVGLTNGAPDLQKLNSFRAAFDEVAGNTTDASPASYCAGINSVTVLRLANDTFFANLTSPDPTYANSLFTFLAGKLSNDFSATGLNCAQLLNVPNPVTLTINQQGVITAANIAIGSPTKQADGTQPLVSFILIVFLMFYCIYH